MNNIMQVYKALHRRYGPQGWWPLSEKGMPTHSGKRPERDNERFEIIAGAILTQNTSWNNAEKALVKLNEHKLVSVEKIAAVKREKLAGLIRSSGYYNQKAERLKLMAGFLKKHSIAELNKLKTEELRELLQNIKGIGPETADSIVLYAFEKPVFVVDAYTKRLFSRLGLVKENASYDVMQELFHNNLKKDVGLFKEYHALIVQHGKERCKSRPDCDCVLKGICKQ